MRPDGGVPAVVADPDLAGARFDVVIVGGGVAGCVLAARLSEDPQRSVCLLEAGSDYGPQLQAWPEKLRNARALSRDEVWERHAATHRIRARVLGGSSCINGCWNTWGSVADHREWADLVGPSWSAAELEPFRLRALDQMRLLPPPGHEVSPFSAASLDAARQLGFAEVADMAAPGAAPGYGMPLLNAVDGIRWNVALRYLTAARSRPNLTIACGATAHRLVVRCGRVHGVEVELAGGLRTIVAGTYLLASGTFGSPAILLRSGVGPARQLAELGVTTVVDLPGVGENLSDQPGVFVPLTPTADLSAALAAKEAAGQLYVSRVLVRAASDLSPLDGWDLHILPVAGPPLFGKLPPGRYEAGVSAFLMKPASRGRLRLRSDDPDVPPDIDSAFLSDPDGHDVAVMRAGLRLVEQLVEVASVAAMASRGAGCPSSERDDAELRGRAGAYWHPVGTCAAGPDSDPAAVVDQYGRVHGLPNLRVVDASILPTVPAANTQLPVLAVAEMLADTLRGQA